jgi:hypothetical protein
LLADAGVTHNIPLLRDVLTEKTFNSGTFTTSYLQAAVLLDYLKNLAFHLEKNFMIDSGQCWGSVTF